MLVTFLTFAVVVLIFLAGLVVYLKPSAKSPVSSIPGLEPTDEKLGNLPDISTRGSFHEFLVDLHSVFGPIASFWHGTEFCVSVATADLFKDVQQLFDKPASIFEALIPAVSRKSLQFANGVEGKRRYKLYSEKFSHQSCVHLMPVLNKHCEELAANWTHLPPDEHIPLHEYMMALAIKLITATHFGNYFKKDKSTLDFHTLYERLMINLEPMLMGASTKSEKEKLERTLTEFKGSVKNMVRVQNEARESGDYEKAPFLDALLDNAGDDEEEVVADATTFVIGGFHTTGNFLTWFFYYLSIYPEIQERVAEEIRKVMAETEVFDEEAITKLTYTSQVLEETLRCSITGPYAARVDEGQEIVVGGHRIPPKTPIIVAIGVSLMDEKYFEDAGKFDPDRFSKANMTKRPSLAFSPFGLGVRKCPGYKFSYFEVYSAAVAVISRFKVRPAFDSDYFVEPKFGFVTKPETEIWIKIEERYSK